jgi:hypothetical protein
LPVPENALRKSTPGALSSADPVVSTARITANPGVEQRAFAGRDGTSSEWAIREDVPIQRQAHAAAHHDDREDAGDDDGCAPGVVLVVHASSFGSVESR